MALDKHIDKVAIVTGASSGIGRAIALALEAEQFNLVIVGRNSRTVNELLAELYARSANRSNARHIGLPLDVGVEADMRLMAKVTLQEFGRIDLLLASAGIGKKTGSSRVMPHPVATLPLDEWDEVINVNLTGVFLSNRAVIPTMIAQKSGQIINICSSTTPAGLRGRPFASAYSASKYGVVGLTESLAAEVEQYGVRVQAVFPGPVATPLVDNTSLARPFGGTVTAENFASAVMYLVKQGSDATVINPHIIPFRGAFSDNSEDVWAGRQCKDKSSS